MPGARLVLLLPLVLGLPLLSAGVLHQSSGPPASSAPLRRSLPAWRPLLPPSQLRFPAARGHWPDSLRCPISGRRGLFDAPGSHSPTSSRHRAAEHPADTDCPPPSSVPGPDAPSPIAHPGKASSALRGAIHIVGAGSTPASHSPPPPTSPCKSSAAHQSGRQSTRPPSRPRPSLSPLRPAAHSPLPGHLSPKRTPWTARGVASTLL